LLGGCESNAAHEVGRCRTDDGEHSRSDEHRDDVKSSSSTSTAQRPYGAGSDGMTYKKHTKKGHLTNTGARRHPPGRDRLSEDEDFRKRLDQAETFKYRQETQNMCDVLSSAKRGRVGTSMGSLTTRRLPMHCRLEQLTARATRSY
jgi:hypothetical protein